MQSIYNLFGVNSTGLDKLTALDTLKKVHIDPLLKCKQVTSLFNSLQDVLCVSSVNAVGYVAVASGMIGCTLIIGK